MSRRRTDLLRWVGAGAAGCLVLALFLPGPSVAADLIVLRLAEPPAEQEAAFLSELRLSLPGHRIHDAPAPRAEFATLSLPSQLDALRPLLTGPNSAAVWLDPGGGAELLALLVFQSDGRAMARVVQGDRGEGGLGVLVTTLGELLGEAYGPAEAPRMVIEPPPLVLRVSGAADGEARAAVTRRPSGFRVGGGARIGVVPGASPAALAMVTLGGGGALGRGFDLEAGFEGGAGGGGPGFQLRGQGSVRAGWFSPGRVAVGPFLELAGGAVFAHGVATDWEGVRPLLCAGGGIALRIRGPTVAFRIDLGVTALPWPVEVRDLADGALLFGTGPVEIVIRFQFGASPTEIDSVGRNEGARGMDRVPRGRMPPSNTGVYAALRGR